MATRTSITNFDPALKQLYRSSNVAKATYKNRPLFGLLKKFEGFGGRNMPVVVQYGNPMGRSTTFATAQSNATEVKLEDFLVTRVSDYSVALIDGEVVEATRGDKMAFLQALKTKIDSAMAALADAIETKLFRTGTGSIGTVGSESTVSLTLAEIEEVCNYEVGMELGVSATDGSALRGSPSYATVTAVNRSTGILTSDSNWTAQISGLVAGDYIYVQGDGANGSGSLTCIAGLAVWLPTGTPSALFGVTRTTDGRLYGTYHNGADGTVEEAMIDIQSKIAREGGSPDKFVCAHVQVRKLIKELGSKKEYTDVNAQDKKGRVANVGYRAVVVHGDEGPMEVIAANKCQAEIGWALTSSSWTLATLGNATKFLMEDGLRILRGSNYDGYEVRLGFRGNLYTNQPQWSGHCALPAV